MCGHSCFLHWSCHWPSCRYFLASFLQIFSSKYNIHCTIISKNATTFLAVAEDRFESYHNYVSGQVVSSYQLYSFGFHHLPTIMCPGAMHKYAIVHCYKARYMCSNVTKCFKEKLNNTQMKYRTHSNRSIESVLSWQLKRFGKLIVLMLWGTAWILVSKTNSMPF